MAPEELNDILLHAITYGWTNQSYIQGWDFEGKIYKDTCKMFEPTKISDQVYGLGTPCKTTSRADANSASHVRKRKLGESALSNNPDNGCTGNHKKSFEAIQAIVRPLKNLLVAWPLGTPKRSAY